MIIVVVGAVIVVVVVVFAQYVNKYHSINNETFQLLKDIDKLRDDENIEHIRRDEKLEHFRNIKHIQRPQHDEKLVPQHSGDIEHIHDDKLLIELEIEGKSSSFMMNTILS
jgi:FtsZ-interacting cell division protein ZipA